MLGNVESNSFVKSHKNRGVLDFKFQNSTGDRYGRINILRYDLNQIWIVFGKLEPLHVAIPRLMTSFKVFGISAQGDKLSFRSCLHLYLRTV